ncbi:hypothetical protein BJY52DRAFT_1220027 [Lactarius psammicola]|nr:hypothetical protein BJY52DRAFT_1220027 [Lactarius psammicola]
MLLKILQTCDSPTAILSVLQEKAREFDQVRSGDERLTKWLNPTVNVLYAFSAALGEGAGLVYSPAKVIFAGIGVFLLGLVGGQGRCGKSRRGGGSLRADGVLFQTTGGLYRGDTDRSDDGYNYEDNGRSADDLWDRDQGDKAGTRE